MDQLNVPVLQFKNSSVFGIHPTTQFICFQTQSRSNSSRLTKKPLVVEARANARTESPKLRNRRIQKKFNGTARNPRLSVFCSDKQLYAMLVDDKNKKCLFYASTLQKSIRNPPCSTSVSSPPLLIDMCWKLLNVLGRHLSKPVQTST
ncbi:uncharacterized protein LOC107643659 isoform X2 [Arachis ipaensis]|uniref:uncharacterized protein LOC107643659 isoform X2 n=1 Tax=Arachis ipaensis TaxID=130454 RepID=UPI000A2B5F42|nr:uncharacterized protein LOC107643659 isoform X2 [Arachis ipaensis]XP_029148485.1 uncharacterized protein LOC112750378 isoform X2 [Arachis hypogaea]